MCTRIRNDFCEHTPDATRRAGIARRLAADRRGGQCPSYLRSATISTARGFLGVLLGAFFLQRLGRFLLGFFLLFFHAFHGGLLVTVRWTRQCDGAREKSSAAVSRPILHPC